MELILFTTETEPPQEREILKELFRLGLKRLQVRKPMWSRERLAEWLDFFEEEELSRMWLHQHHELALRFAVGGIHHGGAYQNPGGLAELSVLKRNRPELAASLSLHQPEELKQERPQYGDAFFSPVFPSLSKENYLPLHSPETIRRAVAEARLPVIALGGIDKTNLNRLKRMGFTRAALLGGIWRAANPIDAFLELTTESHEQLENR